VTLDEYERFYEKLANTKIPYKYMIHYSTDVPLAIKAILYIPSNHSEKMGFNNEKSEMHLYCRKVLIKEHSFELLPNYMRFVKGVVDCEDLPLNISREGYQDTSLIMKLKNVLTRRVLKLLDDEAKKDADKYNKWFKDFEMFLKEGLTVDPEN
jgi:TNF receptor-associated protein 1